MYVTECNGMELAKVIRQMDVFVSIPIVFLPYEMNIKKQLTAMGTGGDDFLTKPIMPEHLIPSISQSAERMRIIRSFMNCDILTEGQYFLIKSPCYVWSKDFHPEVS